MKRSIFTFLAVGLCVGLVGCKTKPNVESDKTMFDYMQEQVAKISEKGGMASVGLAESKTIPVAISKAKLAARKNLAQLVRIKIENLEKSFVEEVGEARSSEMNELFSSTTKQITDQTLQGTLPKMQKYETKDGVTTAYVLMVLNPDVIDESLKNNNAKHMYERFRASKAFEELDKDIKAYEASERGSP